MPVVPKKLFIYYGWPIALNGLWSVASVAAELSQYDLGVFGAGLEDSNHPDHQNTIDIIANSSMVNTEVYGYISTKDGLTANQPKIDNWDAMGVKGIFCDEYGFDFG